MVVSSEDHLKRLKYEYRELLKGLEIHDPNRIKMEKRLDNVTLWQVKTTGNIFFYIT